MILKRNTRVRTLLDIMSRSSRRKDMNELVAIFNNCIKSKSSLKECVEFAFHDEEIGMG